MINNPYYIIDFSATNCFIDLRVNDIAVFCLNIEGQLATIVPINNAILETGAQRITYNILPITGEINLQDTMDFRASVCLYDASSDTISYVEEIIQYKVPEEKQGIIPFYKHETVFTANVPYRIEAWKNSMNLKDMDTKELRELVNKEFKKIENYFETFQYRRFIDMIILKESNIATSMYLSQKEQQERINDLLNLLQTGFTVIPTSPLDIMMIYGYGKLVTLIKKNGMSAFLLKNTKGEEITLDLKFHLPQGSNELMII